jgi:hypothetical protein
MKTRYCVGNASINQLHATKVQMIHERSSYIASNNACFWVERGITRNCYLKTDNL